MGKQTSKTVIKAWNSCPYKQLFDNQIWGEIAEEIKAHELTVAAYDVAEFTAEKAMELKSFAVKEFKTQKAVLERKFHELKTLATTKYAELKEQAEEAYEKVIAEYKNMIAKFDNFLETTTIADVVEFVQKKTEELKMKALDAKVQLEEAAKKNIAKAKKLLKEYELKAKALYKKHVEPKVVEYKAKAMAYYNKYYPKLEAKYLELKEQALEKYELYMSEGKKMFYAYKVKGTELYKKTMRQAKNKWMRSEIRAKLMTLKGMTIKETIEALKKLPKETELYVKAMYAEYSAKALAEFNQQYAKLIKEFEMRREQFIELAKPYYVPAMKAYRWVENEVTETAIFVYRYHRVEERSIQLKNYVVSEIQRLTPIVKASMKKLAQECRVKGQQLAYDAITTAGDKTLRGIHSGMRYLDNVDMKQYQNKLRATLTELNRYIAFDEGKITTTIPHGEVKPSISHHIKKVGKYAERTIKDVKQEAKKMLKKVKAELAKIRARAEKLREQMTKAVMENTVEIRQDMKKSMTINNKIAQRVYEKATIFGQKSYKQAMIKYKNLKSKAKVMIQKAKALSKKYYKKFVQLSQKAYLKSSEIFMDIYGAGIFKMHKRAYFHADRYYTMAKTQVNKMVKQHKPSVMKMYKKYTTMVKSEFKKMQREIMPYYR